MACRASSSRGRPRAGVLVTDITRTTAGAAPIFKTPGLGSPPIRDARFPIGYCQFLKCV
jgi:hypothetical protein